MTAKGLHILNASARVASIAYMRQMRATKEQLRAAHDVMEATYVPLTLPLVDQYHRVIDVILNEIHTPLVGAKWDKR